MPENIIDTTIPVLGESKIPSPILTSGRYTHSQCFVTDRQRVLIDVNPDHVSHLLDRGREIPAFELAGARKKIYFDPSKLRCALVTCGGLCPGLNDIIRAIVLELSFGYGVRHIYGIRYGLQGLIPEFGHDLMELFPAAVADIHKSGGSVLGSSRGPQSIEEIVDSLERLSLGTLFMIGGGGTLMAANKIADAVIRRGLKISIVGIPKTIDNDIHLISRSFGFDTAVDVATMSIRGAHNEAVGYPNGIGLIKLMGRHSGFIAATAALARQDVNFVLIPEVDFDLKGPGGFLAALKSRLEHRKHAVIVVAEGAGQKFFNSTHAMQDDSGNIRLQDIGLFLKNAIITYFRDEGIPVSLKYIDPSYILRSLPANANDNVFCSFLGRDAVHAAMTGKTKFIIGYWNDHFVHVPMAASAGKCRRIDPFGKLWLNVLEATGQGPLIQPGP
ncbi:MAG: ATP-dependent 6-phosphofructokinase [Deltaproteobacteria bacterium]|nr:ATP-dependent 6-phosphofructokinase [Deltaproteobacteria bacterium]